MGNVMLLCLVSYQGANLDLLRCCTKRKKQNKDSWKTVTEKIDENISGYHMPLGISALSFENSTVSGNAGPKKLTPRVTVHS